MSERVSECECLILTIPSLSIGHAALCLYAQVFEQQSALHHLEAFACHHGADFYGLPRSTHPHSHSHSHSVVRLKKCSWVVPESYSFGESTVTPLCAGEELQWRVVHTDNDSDVM